MAAYVRQGGQIALLLSEAEAMALRDLALYAEAAIDSPTHTEKKAAADRATRALAAVCGRDAPRSGSF